MTHTIKTGRGSAHPYGTTRHPSGVNFSIFSKHATAVSLCLFKPGDSQPYCELVLDPKKHKTGNVWHIFVHHISLHDHYAYRIDGPYDPLKGHFFDNRQILLDPYAKLVASEKEWGSAQTGFAHFQKGVVYPLDPFDWEDDAHPRIPMKDLIIYEMHVRGFTQDPSSQVVHPGSYLGLIEKIPYLKELGINAIELMPIHEFNECENRLTNPLTGDSLYNYWGYSSINFFSPMNRYAASKHTIKEFKSLVKALHAQGIEVILDVVYNHTAEGNQEGPSVSFKGIENSVYYMLGPNGEYYNFSGCGNTVNCNHPVVREMIRDSLRYWVTEMHIDGFRFDLASILVRSHDGVPLANPPLIEALSFDPILAHTKLIAEAWDAGGLYQVGSFPGMGRWSEWNGKFRDSVRRFVKGTDAEVGNFATRISGSEDLYGKGRLPINSINFITAHDGFTLADLVAYNTKHNEANGENNRDGANDNESWNCNCEGDTSDPLILELRNRQMKNFLVALFVSQGVPMLLMGDEYGHTREGNNNTFSHDSRLNWFQWDTLEKNAPFYRFCKELIRLRKEHPVLMRSRFLSNQDVIWHGVEPDQPDWGMKSRLIACSLPDLLEGYTLYIAFNAYFHEVQVRLPKRELPWQRLVYTALASPKDILDRDVHEVIQEEHFNLAPYSALILKALEPAPKPKKTRMTRR